LKLTLTPFAIEREERIFDYIAEHSGAQNALMVRRRIFKTLERIADFPRSGWTRDRSNRREMGVTGTKYIVRYTLTGKEIRVTDIKHGAQHLKEGSN
jgi:plasmid stabilization system protein ParE